MGGANKTDQISQLLTLCFINAEARFDVITVNKTTKKNIQLAFMKYSITSYKSYGQVIV